MKLISSLRGLLSRSWIAAPLGVLAVTVTGVLLEPTGGASVLVGSVSVAMLCLLMFMALCRRQLRERLDQMQERLGSELAHAQVVMTRDAANWYRQIEALQALWGTLPIRAPLPPLGAWRVSADTAVVLLDQVLRARPVTICEFGSGVSSVLLGYCAVRLSAQGGLPTTVLSFEHDEAHAEATRRMLAMHDLLGTVTVLHAPLVTLNSIASERTMVYDPEVTAAAGDRSVGLLFVDGPPWRDGDARDRESAAFAFRRALAPGAILVFDDATRDEAVITRLAATLDAADLQFVPSEKGTAVVVLRSDGADENAARTQ